MNGAFVQVDNHVMCAVAGLTADANILINQARVNAQRFLYQYGEPQPIEQLVVQLCDIKQVSMDSRLLDTLREIGCNALGKTTVVGNSRAS